MLSLRGKLEMNKTREVSVPHRTHNHFLNLAKMMSHRRFRDSIPLLRLSQDIRNARILYPVTTNIRHCLTPQSTLQTEGLARIWIQIPMGHHDLVGLANTCIESAQNYKFKMRKWEIRRQ